MNFQYNESNSNVQYSQQVNYQQQQSGSTQNSYNPTPNIPTNPPFYDTAYGQNNISPNRPIYEQHNEPVKIADGPDVGEIKAKLKSLDFGYFAFDLFPKLVTGCGVTGSVGGTVGFGVCHILTDFINIVCCSLFILYLCVLIGFCVLFHCTIMKKLYAEEDLKGFEAKQVGARAFFAVGQADVIGVIAIGQVAMGLCVFGQVAIGCCTIGMVPVGICWCFIPLLPFLLFFCVSCGLGSVTFLGCVVSLVCGGIGVLCLPGTFLIKNRNKKDDDDEDIRKGLIVGETETTVEQIYDEQRDEVRSESFAVSINSSGGGQGGRPGPPDQGTGPIFVRPVIVPSSQQQHHHHQQVNVPNNIPPVEYRDFQHSQVLQSQQQQEQQFMYQGGSQSIDSVASKPPTVPDFEGDQGVY